MRDKLQSVDAGAGRNFVDLPEGARFFAPDGVEEGLLTDSFVRADTRTEEEVLGKLLGVQTIPLSEFYRQHMFPRLGTLPVELRTRTMLKVLAGLQQLGDESGGVAAALAELAFVPTAQGSLVAPSR